MTARPADLLERALDVLAASALLLIPTPLMLAVAVAVAALPARRASAEISLVMHHDLRRLLASLDYRFQHVTRGAPADFGGFTPGAGVRTPLETVRHLCDLVEFIGRQFRPAAPDPAHATTVPEGEFDAECRRFRAALRALDGCLAEGRPFGPDRQGLDYAGLLQGPVCDALTHVGQLAMLRRLAGSPIDRVRYWQMEMPLPADAHRD